MELMDVLWRQGLKDVNELRTAYQDKIHDQRRKAIDANAFSSSPSASSASPPQPTKPIDRSHFTATSIPPPPKTSHSQGIKTLSSYIDIPKTHSLPPKEIEYIWRLRHASSPQSLCAAIPYPTYALIEGIARRHPQFILPLPREGQGAEIHFLQWTFPTPNTATVLFTHLAEFKLRGEFSQPHTTVTHHLDLAKDKGLVLLEGSVIKGRGVTVEEGRWLLMCLQRFYGGGDDKTRRKKLLEQFSQGDGGFKVEDLLEEAEKIIWHNNI